MCVCHSLELLLACVIVEELAVHAGEGSKGHLARVAVCGRGLAGVAELQTGSRTPVTHTGHAHEVWQPCGRLVALRSVLAAMLCSGMPLLAGKGAPLLMLGGLGAVLLTAQMTSVILVRSRVCLFLGSCKHAKVTARLLQSTEVPAACSGGPAAG